MAQTEERDIILEITPRIGEALEQIDEYQQAVDELQKANKELKKELESETITREAYNKAVAKNKAELQNNRQAVTLLTRDVSAYIRAGEAQNDSLRGMRNQVNDLTRAYDTLSKSEREAASGQALLKQIKDLRGEINGLTAETGRFQQEVGNYEGAIQRALTGNNSFLQSLLSMADAEKKGADGVADYSNQLKGLPGIANTAKTAISGIGTAISNMGKVLLANPVIAIIAAIVAVLLTLKKALDSSEAATQRLNAVLAPLRRLLDFLLNILQQVVSFVLDGVEAFLSLAMALSKLAESLPLVGSLFKEVNDEIEKSIALENEKYALEQRTREQMVQNAKDARDIAKLRTEAQDKEKNSFEERLKFVQEANAIEKKNADAELAIRQEALRIAEEEAARAENNQETERTLADLRAATYNAELAHYNKVRELLGQEQAIRAEMVAAETKKVNDAKTARKTAAANAKTAASDAKARRDNEIKARRQYEDTLLSLEKDGLDKLREQANRESDRRIEDLKNQLAFEEKLTQAARETITKQIEIEEKVRAKNLDRLSKENLDKESERQLEIIDLRLSAIRKEGKEAEQLRIEALEEERKIELRYAEQEGIDRSLVNAKYDALISDERKASQKAAFDQMRNERMLQYQIDLNDARLEGESQLAVTLELRREELSQLAQLEGESESAYLARRTLLSQQIVQLEKDTAAQTLEMANIQAQALETIFGALSEFAEEFAEDNEALASFSKALALFEIGVNTARALSAGIAAAQSVPFPGNLAAIATTVGTILANIASARQILSKQKEPKAKFATGGLIRGEGSGTSDSVPIVASNGESVMAARATEMFAPLLSNLNQMGGGIPIQTVNASAQVYGEDMLAKSFAKALAAMPAPFVTVEEIDRVKGRVNTLVKEASI